MSDWLTETLASPFNLATEPKPISEAVAKAHAAQVARLEQGRPTPPVRGTLSWSVEAGAFVLTPSEDSDLWERAINGLEVTVKVAI